jgi:hypothetical protein
LVWLLILIVKIFFQKVCNQSVWNLTNNKLAWSEPQLRRSVPKKVDFCLIPQKDERNLKSSKLQETRGIRAPKNSRMLEKDTELLRQIVMCLHLLVSLKCRLNQCFRRNEMLSCEINDWFSTITLPH